MDSLISVIIPAYQHESYVGEAIQSVLDQTYSHWELIFIDDCSKDSTYDIAKLMLENDKRVILTRKEKNQGLVHSLNVGIKLAKGEYITFLASDDFWDSMFLELSLETAKLYKDAIIFSGVKNRKNYFNLAQLVSYNSLRKTLLKCNPINAIGCIYPCLFLKNIIDIDQSIYLEDLYIRWKSVLLGVDYFYTGKRLIHYRQPAGSMSSNKRKMSFGRWQIYQIFSPKLSFMERIKFFLFTLYKNHKIR